MNDQYYSREPESASRPVECAFSFRGKDLRFTTDSGVFSRGELDTGTRLLLEALPEELSGDILDLGCGWGAIGISLKAVFPGASVTLADVNLRALELSRKNAVRNGVKVECVESDGLSALAGRRWDAVITNPPIRAGKAVIQSLFAQAASALKPEGALYLVIRKQQGAESCIAYLKTLFSSVEKLDRSGGFWVIKACGAIQTETAPGPDTGQAAEKAAANENAGQGPAPEESTTRFTFRYGSGTVEAELPNKNILAVLHGNQVPPLSDIPSALAYSVEHPIGSAPLAEFIGDARSVCLVVSDMSRFWMRQDLIIPHLVKYLCDRCALSLEQITIVVANGTHPAGDEKDLRTLVTDAVFDQVKVINHDCRAKDLVYMGTTSLGTPVRINSAAAEADRVVCLGACVHHVMAGFGGGRKSILPGISSLETVRKNHSFALDPRVFKTNSRVGNGKLEDNPMNQDMCEAAGLVPHLFMINLVLNSDMKHCGIFSGHYIKSWEAACREVDRICRVPVPCRADAVIASCGGYPKDMSLYQGTKSIDNVETGLKPGGTLILLIEAREGGGPSEYFDWIQNLQDGTFEEKLRSEFTVPGYIFFLNCEQARRYRILMLTSIPPEVIAPMGIEAFSDMESLLRAADLGDKSLYVIPNGSMVVPFVE